jgi:hypothetical protein
MLFFDFAFLTNYSPVLMYRGNLSVTLPSGVLDDNMAHSIFVTVVGKAVTLKVDNVVKPSVQLQQLANDCGNATADSCVLYLGQESTSSGGDSRLGLIFAVGRIYPRTAVWATQLPAMASEGSFNFVSLSKTYIPGRNQGGSFPGLSQSDCAQTCLNMPLCQVPCMIFGL